MLKSTGMVRKVDELGRIVLPMELRRTMNINEKDPLEIFTDGEKIILTKYSPGCIFCGNVNGVGVQNYKGKYLCDSCIQEIGQNVI